MKLANLWLGCLASVAISAGCAATDESNLESVESSSAELLGTTTTTARTTVICSDSSAIMFSIEATTPKSVAPGETFSLSLTFQLQPPILPPYSGLFAGSASLSAARATPVDPSIAFEPYRFTSGAALPNFGAGSATLTAANKVGSPVEVRLAEFDYTLDPDPADRNPIDAHCPSADAATAIVATVPIVSEPKCKDDCKRGGFANYTNATGAVFKNQGQCIKYAK